MAFMNGMDLFKSTLNFVTLILCLYPIFNITAIAADKANNWNFVHKGKGGCIDIIAAGVSVRIIRNTDDIHRATFWAFPCVFHLAPPAVK